MEGGQHYGAWEVVDRLSAGGMGVVWRARGLADGGEVAIKTVRTTDESTLRGIRAEIRALRRVRHPGVVRILDEGVRDGLPWYAMELLRGSTLRTVLAELHGRTDLPEESTLDPASTAPDPGEGDTPRPVAAAGGHLPRVLDLFRSLSEILAWLHGEGIVHRDLKPENVFVGPDGAPVLVDFGLAHEIVGAGASRESLDALTLDGGTVTYMAPEQALGDLVDARADLYALGAMLFEAVAGRPPFAGSRSAVVFAKLGQRAPPVDRFATHVPGPLGRLLEDLLHPDPRARTAHARVVSGVLASLGAADPPPGPWAPRPYVYRPGYQPLGDVVRSLIDGAHPGWVHVAGDAGSGKTRVLVEVAQSLRQAGTAPVTCACVPAAGAAVAAPLDPLRPLLRAVLDRALAAPGGPEAAVLARHGELLARFEPAIRELPHLAVGAAPDLRPDTERLRLFEALRAALASTGGRALLIVDDWQYADELTAAFLASLRPEDYGETIVLSAGSGPPPGAARTTPLPPLAGDGVRAMIASMCGGTDAPPALVSAIAERAAGRPFVVAELVREAVRTGLLDRDRSGTWTLRDVRPDALRFPATVTEQVERQLATVSPEAWPALGWAAVLGYGAEEELLLRRADPVALDALEAAGLLGFDDRGRLRLGSPALAAVVHDRLPAAERRRLHAEAAEGLLPARPGRHGRVARHLREAGDPRAFVASLSAGEEALAEIAFERAVTELLHARERLPADAPPELRTRVELRLGRAFWGAGDANRCRETLDAALVPVGESAPAGTRGVLTVLRLLGAELWRLVRTDRSPEPGVAAAEHHADLAEAHRYLVYLEILRNEPLRMLVSALRASAHGARGGRRARRATDVATLGVIAGFAGLGPLSRAWFARAEERLRRSGDRHDEVLVSLALASLALGNGRWDEVHAAIDRGERAASAVGDAEQGAVLGQMRCTALQLAGRVQEAVARADVVIRTARSQMPRLWARCVLVDALSSAGETERADAEVRTVLAELGEDGGDRATRSNVLALRAALLLDRGLAAEARALVSQASSLCREGSEEAFGVFPYHCHAPAVWLRLLERSPEDPALRAEATRSVSGAARYAARFAIGRPAALRHEAVLRELVGGGLPGVLRSAAGTLARAREAALALGMGEHALLAEAEALRGAPDADAAAVLRQQAAERGWSGALRRTAAGRG